MSNLIQLPVDTLYELISHLSFDEIAKLCQTSASLNNLCKNESFWSFKFRKEHGRDPHGTISAKDIYYSLNLYKKRLEKLNMEYNNLSNIYREKIVSELVSKGITSDKIKKYVYKRKFFDFSHLASENSRIFSYTVPSILMDIEPDLKNNLANVGAKIIIDGLIDFENQRIKLATEEIPQVKESILMLEEM